MPMGVLTRIQYRHQVLVDDSSVLDVARTLWTLHMLHGKAETSSALEETALFQGIRQG